MSALNAYAQIAGFWWCSSRHCRRGARDQRADNHSSPAPTLPRIPGGPQMGPTCWPISSLRAAIKFFTGAEVSFFNHTALS